MVNSEPASAAADEKIHSHHPGMREYINEDKVPGFMATRNAAVKKRPWWNMKDMRKNN